MEHFDSVQVGSFPIFSLPGAESCLLRMRGRIQVCQGVPNGFWQQPGAPTYPPHSTSPALKARMTFSCSVSGAGRFGSMSQPDLQGGAGKALVVKASYT